MSCDPWFACIFGFENSGDMVGMGAKELMPSLALPENMEGFSKVCCIYVRTYVRIMDNTVFRPDILVRGGQSRGVFWGGGG